MQETAQYFDERFFYKQVLDFNRPYKIFYATHRNYEILSKSLVSITQYKQCLMCTLES
jgi:hypothetical protein